MYSFAWSASLMRCAAVNILFIDVNLLCCDLKMAAKLANQSLGIFRRFQLTRQTYIIHKTILKRSYHIDDTLTGISDEQRQVWHNISSNLLLHLETEFRNRIPPVCCVSERQYFPDDWCWKINEKGLFYREFIAFP